MFVNSEAEFKNVNRTGEAHEVNFSILKRDLSTACVELDVHRNGSKRSTIRVSTGS